MAGKRELGFVKASMHNLKEQVVRTTLRNVRSQGHTYVELREDGKKLIFFCTLCLAPCYSDSVLFNHLKGNQHCERLEGAKLTLLKPNPWPFTDGVFFFQNDSPKKEENISASNSERFSLLDGSNIEEDSLAIVSYAKHVDADKFSLDMEDDVDSDVDPIDPVGNGRNFDLVIPGVLQKEQVSDLVVRHMGFGRIGARFCEKEGICRKISRIWCEWLGNKYCTEEDLASIQEHDFAVVTFSYNYHLGRKGFLDDYKYLLPSSPHSEAENGGSSKGKKRKSFSDPEDVSYALSNQYDSSGEESLSSNSSNAKLLLAGNDDQVVYSRVLSSKTMRKELRRQQRIFSERLCHICQQKMLPGKDVAALFNRKTGRLVCSSRNVTGAFHVFHISCLIHWILLCEFEVCSNQPVAPKAKRKSKRKVITKKGEKGRNREVQATSNQICSAFCPECQGTGINIEGKELEKPAVPLSEMFRYKIKLSDAHKAWMKSPEVLQNCSLGFYFPQPEDMYLENVASLKILHFYHADDSISSGVAEIET